MGHSSVPSNVVLTLGYEARTLILKPTHPCLQAFLAKRNKADANFTSMKKVQGFFKFTASLVIARSCGQREALNKGARIDWTNPEQQPWLLTVHPADRPEASEEAGHNMSRTSSSCP